MAQYTGRVFVDENRNNILDKGEKQLCHVSVSDGLNVVQTDSNGTYQLPGHSRMRFLFITTPSGYKTDNAYYCRVEAVEQDTTFPYILATVAFRRMGLIDLYIFLIQRYIVKKGIRNGQIIFENIRLMKKLLLSYIQGIFVMNQD